MVTPLSLQEEPYEKEVDGDADAEHRDGCPLLVDANPDEEVERCELQHVVDDVRYGKSSASFCRCLHAEREAGGRPEIKEEAYDVAYCQRKAWREPVEQHPIDGILKKGGCNTD